MKIRDIADHLGVSPATVSLALKGDARVNTVTRERVTAYCREVGYTPSFSARNLSARRSFTLHLVCAHDEHDSPNRFLTDFLAGATEVASAHQYRVTLSFLRDGDFQALEPHLRDGSADAFMLLNPAEAGAYGLFEAAGAPLLVVGRYDSPWGERVDSDNVAVGRDIAAHLRVQGYRRPALLGPLELTFTADRFAGLNAGATGAGLFDCRDMDGAMAACDRALEDGHDSIVVTDDALLPGVLRALKRAGLTAPEIGVVGMGNDLSPYLDPEVTSIDFDARRLGQVAATQQLRSIHVLPAPGPPLLTVVPHRLIPRRSTQRSPS